VAHSCDFVEELWTGATELKIPITNWSTTPAVVPIDQAVGEIEEVSGIGQDDPVWKQLEESVVARIKPQDLLKRHCQVRDQLVIGDNCQDGERQAFIQLLCAKHHVFALSDLELGETELVEHQIDLVDGKPIRVPLRRLPYVLRTELDSELAKLRDTGCTEPSNSPYASGNWCKSGRKIEGTGYVLIIGS